MNQDSKFVQAINAMSHLELAKLVAAMENRFGTSYVSAPTVTTNSNGTVTPVVESKTYTVICESVPADKKIAVIKYVREKKNIGLKEAKEYVDGFPKNYEENVETAQAQKIQSELQALGIVVTLKGE